METPYSLRSTDENLALYAIARASRYPLNIRNGLLFWIQEHFPYSVMDLFRLVITSSQKITSLQPQHIDLIYDAYHKMDALKGDIEALYNDGVTLVPLSSHHYPKVLFERLPLQAQPPILYVKGNPAHLIQPMTALTSLRQVNPRSMHFTNDLLLSLQEQQTPIICGTVSNADVHTLDFAISQEHPTLAVLSRGILSRSIYLKDLLKASENQHLTTISPFYPQRTWSESTEATRQRLMHLLSNRTYVIETQRGDAVFDAATAAIQQKHPVYVRVPGPKEHSGNESLIIRGGLPVDHSLNVLFHESFGERLNSYLAGKRASLTEIKKHFRIKGTNEFFKEDLESLNDIGFRDQDESRFYFTKKPELNQISLFGEI